MKYLDTQAAADHCNVSKRTFETWLSKRIVPHRRIGRIIRCVPEELDEAMARFKVEAIGAGKPRKFQVGISGN